MDAWILQNPTHPNWSKDFALVRRSCQTLNEDCCPLGTAADAFDRRLVNLSENDILFVFDRLKARVAPQG